MVPPDSAGPRRLRRRPDDGPIAGVCAGLAEYFNIDPVIVRICAVVLLISGPGFFAYVLAWICVPAEEGPAVYGASGARRGWGGQVLGIVLVVVAISVLWGDWWSPARRWFLPFALICVGAWLLLRRDDDGHDRAEAKLAAPESEPVVVGGPVTTPMASSGGDSTVQLPASDVTAVTAPWDLPRDAPTPPEVPPPPDALTPPLPHEPPARRHGRLAGSITMGALLVWAGIAWLAGVQVEDALAVGLCIIGVGFVLGAFVGGSPWLVIPALVVGAALFLTAVVDIPLRGPVGQHRWSPQTISEVDDPYELSAGEGTLDLRAISIPAGEELSVDASVGMGHLIVEVPYDATVEVTTDIGMGEAVVFGTSDSGIGVGGTQVSDPDLDAGRLVLDLRVGLGQIEVRRGERLATSEPSTPTTDTLG